MKKQVTFPYLIGEESLGFQKNAFIRDSIIIAQPKTFSKILLSCTFFFTNQAFAQWIASDTTSTMCQGQSISDCAVSGTLLNAPGLYALTNTDVGISSLTNTGIIEAGVDNEGVITALNNSGIIKNTNTTANNNGINNQNLGEINSITNTGTIQGNNGIHSEYLIDNITNSGLIQGLTNGIHSEYTIGQIINTGTIQGSEAGILGMGSTISSLSNRGKILFSAQNGSQIKLTQGMQTNSIDIKEWHITLDKPADDYNNINTINLVNGNANEPGHIFVSGNTLDEIIFNANTIKLNVDKNYELNKAYKIQNTIIKNDNGNLSVAGNAVTNLVTKSLGLTAANFVDANPNDTIDITASNTDIIGTQATPTNPITPNPAPSGGGSSVIIPAFNANKAISNTLVNSLTDEGVRRVHFIQNIISDSINGAINNVALDGISVLRLKNLEFSNYHLFALPYYNTTDSNTANTNAYGIITGANKNFEEEGVFGFYLGYETADTEASYTQEFNDDTFYFGLNHYKELYRNANRNIYLKSMLTTSYARSDISRFDNVDLKNYSDNARIYSYGVNINAGMHFFLDHYQILTPELGMYYTKYKVGHFSIDGEHYSDTTFNLLQPSATLSYQVKLKDNLALKLKSGLKLNLDKSVDNAVVIGRNLSHANIKLSSVYGFLDGGLNCAINANTNLSFNYNFLGNNGLVSHTGYLRLDYRW